MQERDENWAKNPWAAETHSGAWSPARDGTGGWDQRAIAAGACLYQALVSCLGERGLLQTGERLNPLKGGGENAFQQAPIGLAQLAQLDFHRRLRFCTGSGQIQPGVKVLGSRRQPCRAIHI